jgi:multimeric flavodoxin WrbA
MKVVAFNGSPRKDGNTAMLLRKVLAPIARAGIDTELIQVGGQAIRGCTACYHCMEVKDKQCVIKTDMVNDCIQKMVEADGIIMGSPSYFSGMTSELKALIDRAGLVGVANDRMFSRKIGAAVAVHRRGGAVNVVDSINHMFLMSRMIVPGSTYWNFGVGLEREDVSNDEEAIQNMHDLGETIAWLIKNLGPLKDAPAASQKSFCAGA